MYLLGVLVFNSGTKCKSVYKINIIHIKLCPAFLEVIRRHFRNWNEVGISFEDTVNESIVKDDEDGGLKLLWNNRNYRFVIFLTFIWRHSWVLCAFLTWCASKYCFLKKLLLPLNIFGRLFSRFCSTSILYFN